MEKEKYYLIPHTHWDREWRYPIWETRRLLLEFMDQLLDILDNDPDYHYFLMDGQVSPIRDYLEIRPEQTERVRRHIADGRIGIGPWLTLPDLYPIAGESLLRNLNAGMDYCEQFGKPLPVGYNSFGWGQTAQLPQIYADYGFDTIICAKKVSKERAPYSEFMWEGPDGTRVLTSRLGDFARANFFFHAYINTRYGLDFLSEEFAYTPDKSGFAVHHANGAVADQDYFLASPKQGHDFSRLAPGLEESFRANGDTLCKSHQLLLSGCDFSTPQPDLTEVIGKAREAFPEREFVNAPLPEYTAALHEALDGKEIPVVQGELRDGPSCDCSGNALASRMYLKVFNKQAENQLMFFAEPLCSAAERNGAGEYPEGFLKKGWLYLLESHSHDAINGVTQDKTANDVEYRLNQAKELGQVAYDMAARAILQKIDLTDEDPNAQFLCIFNPLPHTHRDVIRVAVDTPKDDHVWSVVVTDEQGKEQTIQECGRSEISCPVHDLDGRPWPYYADRHMVLLDTGDVPAMGYKVLKVHTGETYKPKHHYWYPMRTSRSDEISKTPNVMENTLLKVELQPNGTFDLTEKRTGHCYKGLHYFEDTGDVGSYWTYYAPYDNQTFNTLTAAPRIWMEENGPLQATYVVEHRMVLPNAGEEPLYGMQGKSCRSGEDAELHITSRITLKRDAGRVDIHTDVDNRHRNHRLRAAFPTGILAESSCASGHFTVDRRPVVPARKADGTYWPEMQTLPMQNFVDLSDGYKGLALLSSGLTEYEAAADPARTAYLTLFRAMGNMIVTGWECVNRFPEQDGSQLLRKMEFDYAVYPHGGDWVEGHVYREASALNCAMQAYQAAGSRSGSMERERAFLEIGDDNLVLSACKRADDGQGTILRLYNPTGRTIESWVRFDCPIAKAMRTSMREENREPAAFDGNTLRLRVEHGKIVTVRVMFA